MGGPGTPNPLLKCQSWRIPHFHELFRTGFHELLQGLSRAQDFLQIPCAMRDLSGLLGRSRFQITGPIDCLTRPSESPPAIA